MTAEIAVMNKSAVALAADSKVSIGGDSPSKGYDTVNKLFSLSKSHPVGIMVYGNAEIMGIPWETLIKDYRKNIGNKSFSTIDKWKINFVDYLISVKYFDDKSIMLNSINLVKRQLNSLMSELDELHSFLDGDVSSQKSIIIEFIDEKISELQKIQTKKKPGKEGKEISDRNSAVVKSVCEDIEFEDQDIHDKICDILLLTLTARVQSNLQSGIVISGFGDDEIFPALAEFSTDGIVSGEFRITEKDSAKISPTTSSCIRSFAQHDMVQRFMMGADSDLMEIILNSMRVVTGNFGKELINIYGLKSNKTKKTYQDIEETSSILSDEFGKNLFNMMQSEFAHPVTRMVAILPKEELSHLAESLVALTSLKRRVSIDVETVGGPVDVALISKGDGFIWMKRKHYFSPDLNHQFFRNYGGM